MGKWRIVMSAGALVAVFEFKIGNTLIADISLNYLPASAVQDLELVVFPCFRT